MEFIDLKTLFNSELYVLLYLPTGMGRASKVMFHTQEQDSLCNIQVLQITRCDTSI